MLLCNECGYGILKSTHLEKCITINMNTIKVQDKNINFKPMMTHGLCGCTAIVIITEDKIMFGHHPYKQKILEWYNFYTKNETKFKIILKTPGEYIYINNKYILKCKQENFWKDNINNLHLYPYLESKDHNKYRGTLYIRLKDGKYQYTDYYGKYIDINI